MARFKISRKSVERALGKIRRRRQAQLNLMPTDPATTAILAGLARQYKNNASPQVALNASRKIIATQSIDTQGVTSARTTLKATPLPPKIHSEDLRRAILTAVEVWPSEDQLLEQVRAVIERRKGSTPPPPPAPSFDRQLAAVGLKAGPWPVARSHSSHVTGMKPPNVVLLESLIEALQAYESLGIEGESVVRAMRSLRQYLEKKIP